MRSPYLEVNFTIVAQYYDFYTALYHLQSLIQANHHRIRELEQTVEQLQKELSEIKKEKAIHVDKIEYHFDQLKVETLEGTLNIGLSPKSLEEQIEDLTVNGKQINGDVDENEEVKSFLAQFEHYFDQEFVADVERLSKKYGVPIDATFLPLVKEQLQKQLSDRILYYLQQMKQAHMENDPTIRERILSHTKQDILTALEQFLQQYPKGDGSG